MRLLPDTQTFLWMAAEPERVSPVALANLKNRDNALFISAAVEWELVQWVQEERIQLPYDVPTLVKRQLQSMQAGSLPIHREHLAVYAHLASHHQNPFERMLVAQAMNEGLVIVSGNPVFRKYPVTVLW